MDNTDFSAYSAEDFVLDDHFRRWVNGQLPPEDTFWDTWLRQHPQKAETIRQATWMVKALAMEEATLDQPRMAENLHRIAQLTEREPGTWYLFSPSGWYRVAAALVVLAGLGWYLGRGLKTVVPTKYQEMVLAQTGPTIEKSNTSTQPLKVALSDGSVITLQPHSKISYPEVFAPDKREVYLSGEGFFDIAKKANSPFLVYANEIVTKVLGTSFSVKAYEHDNTVVVKVVTGRVSVLSGKVKNDNPAFSEAEGVILTPNQMVVYARTPEKLTKTLVEHPVLIKSSHTKPSDFNFMNTPLPLVFKKLEAGYGVTIVYDHDVLQNCTLMAPLENETLYEKLDLICKVIGASYEVVDAQIIISSQGCD
ncbi:FecR family protein [Rhabdobacter roseus]|uniref:Ferric-dicitrate binding protein FerR (Iron transport regulator) n=1 Tax=Rhabdobacter roseus TaxID=1655419 RepID=A0A840TVR4_9BACT|nr:FecR family protein [Rhabdobacter roseus]MBB5285672.1 ferric-dicitrate binding protein FerR (iron transport regulator) [Rhabdobacter roseus]